MDKYQLNEEDLNKIFSGTNLGKKFKFSFLINYFLVFLVIFIVSFSIINFTAIVSILSYWCKTEIQVDNQAAQYPQAVVSSQNDSSLDISSSQLPNVADNHILIPKISVNAPISWKVSNSEKEVQSALNNGVVQLNGTSVPGEQGNVFITGHSSNYFWAEGAYKNIFALLENLSVGDLIYIRYQNQLFIYRTSSIKTVKPSDTSVLAGSSDSFLTLMTCTPVGTSINRLIVKSDQISPDPSLNLSTAKTAPANMPGGVR